MLQRASGGANQIKEALFFSDSFLGNSLQDTMFLLGVLETIINKESLEERMLLNLLTKGDLASKK